jgi:hypothetical protein
MAQQSELCQLGRCRESGWADLSGTFIALQGRQRGEGTSGPIARRGCDGAVRLAGQRRAEDAPPSPGFDEVVAGREGRPARLVEQAGL